MSNKDKKIIVVHPGMQHSFRLAETLQEEGMLYSYITTVYDKASSIYMRTLKLFLRGRGRAKAEKRKMHTVPDSQIIQICEARGLILLVLCHLFPQGAISENYYRHVSNVFQRKVARYIVKQDVDMVISYDTSSKVLFEILKKKRPDIIRVIDDAAVCRNYLFKVYEDKHEACKEFEATYRDELGGFLVRKEIADYYGEEARLADFHIVASSFTRKSVRYNGFEDDRIFTTPLGCNYKALPHPRGDGDVLKVLFVGDVNQRKGIGQILHVARTMSGDNLEFGVVGGGGDKHRELFEPYDKYVRFYGRLTPDELVKVYSEYDIFVFPSFGDGFGFVVIEALNAGLPVIASTNCNGPDIIRDGYNGFVIEPGDEDQLEEKIRWFHEDHERVEQMRENAVASAKNFTWENYKTCLTNAVNAMFDIVAGERE